MTVHSGSLCAFDLVEVASALGNLWQQGVQPVRVSRPQQVVILSGVQPVREDLAKFSVPEGQLSAACCRQHVHSPDAQSQPDRCRLPICRGMWHPPPVLGHSGHLSEHAPLVP